MCYTLQQISKTTLYHIVIANTKNNVTLKINTKNIVPLTMNMTIIKSLVTTNTSTKIIHSQNHYYYQKKLL